MWWSCCSVETYCLPNVYVLETVLIMRVKKIKVFTGTRMKRIRREKRSGQAEIDQIKDEVKDVKWQWFGDEFLSKETAAVWTCTVGDEAARWITGGNARGVTWRMLWQPGSIYLMKKQLIHLLLNMYRWITGLCLFVIPLSHTLNMWWMLRLVVSVAASLSFSFIPASLSLRHMCKLEHDTVEEFTLLNTCCYCVSV